MLNIMGGGTNFKDITQFLKDKRVVGKDMVFFPTCFEPTDNDFCRRCTGKRVRGEFGSSLQRHINKGGDLGSWLIPLKTYQYSIKIKGVELGSSLQRHINEG